MMNLKHMLMSILFTPVNENKQLLICYASQTGTAMHLAKESGKLASSAGIATDVEALERLSPEDLNQYSLTLMIVSTCGEGKIPDNGEAFFKHLERTERLTAQVQILALGDKSYRQFCLAGKLFHQQLCRIGSCSREDLTLVNGNPIKVWTQWLESHLEQSLDLGEVPNLNTQTELKLIDKKPLFNTGYAQVGEAYELLLEVVKPAVTSYQVNSLLAITPPGSDRPRLYSVASSPTESPNHIKLCVSRHRFCIDGQWSDGHCSNYLTQQLNVGGTLKAEVRVGGGLSLPKADSPLLLIATGAGIAPMMSMLQERVAQHHTGNNWLIFGNRYSQGDYYYKSKLQHYRDTGVLEQLDTAFSRDEQKKVYVQNVLEEQSDKLSKWLMQEDLHIYVCGRPELKSAILHAIHTVISNNESHPEKVNARMTQLSQTQMTFELF